MLETVFGPLPTGRAANTLQADAMKRAIAEENSDDDFMPPFRPKRQGSGSSKAVVGENSDDDFMPPSRARLRPKPKSLGSSKAVVEEDSDDDLV